MQRRAPAHDRPPPGERDDAEAPRGAIAGWPADAVEVGRIGDAWGVKGWFRVHPYAEPAEALRASAVWHVQGAGGARSLTVDELKAHGDGLVAHAAGVADRDAATRLRGARVFVSRACFPPPGADEYYHADLIGLEVVDRAGRVLGRVAGLLDNGPQSVLRVAVAGATRETLIPFVSAHVDAVDLPARRIAVDWSDDDLH